VIYGSALVLTSQSVTYDPQEGPQLEQVWKGGKAAVAGLTATYAAAGFRTRTTELDDGASVLTVTMPQITEFGGTEVPTDKFGVATEYVQVPIWDSNAFIQKLTDLYLLRRNTEPSVTLEEMLATVREPIESAMKGRRNTGQTGLDSPALIYDTLREGPLLPSECEFVNIFPSEPWVASTVAFMNEIYSLTLRGMTSISQEWPVLRWSRSYSINYLLRRRIPILPPVYTTAALVRDFLIPVTVAAQLPVNPTTKPPFTVYAWRERGRDTDIDWYGKVLDVAEWVFAAWPTTFYSLIE